MSAVVCTECGAPTRETAILADGDQVKVLKCTNRGCDRNSLERPLGVAKYQEM